MKNKYVDFVSDDHLLKCIENLHGSYLKAKADVSKKKFYSNKIDTIKLTFDSKFNDIDEENIIELEILRQIDKSINNSIGTFHEQVLGGIKGYEVGNLSGFDIKAEDDTLFADIKNKHNTMNSSSAESLFQKLARFADNYKAKGSFNEHWRGDIIGKEYSHSRVFKISGDRFYAILSNQDDAFLQLYKALPIAIKDYLQGIKAKDEINENSIFEDIKESSNKKERNILEQITFENYSYYLGFDKL